MVKLETSLGKLARDEELQIVHYRTTPREPTALLLPYLVEVIAADRPGILVKIIEFFSRRDISVEQLSSMRYQAMQTGAEMFQAQMTIGIPSETHIAALRDDFPGVVRCPQPRRHHGLREVLTQKEQQTYA